jgi:hypothetical protein
MTSETTIIDNAINDSIRENRIVHIDDIVINSQNFVNLSSALSAECDDWVETKDEDGYVLREYWGTDKDGDDWRIHLHCNGGKRQ